MQISIYLYQIGAVILQKISQIIYSLCKQKLSRERVPTQKIQFAPIDFVVYFTYNKRKKGTDDNDEFGADGWSNE